MAPMMSAPEGARTFLSRGETSENDPRTYTQGRAPIDAGAPSAPFLHSRQLKLAVRLRGGASDLTTRDRITPAMRKGSKMSRRTTIMALAASAIGFMLTVSDEASARGGGGFRAGGFRAGGFRAGGVRAVGVRGGVYRGGFYRPGVAVGVGAAAVGAAAVGAAAAGAY